MEAPSNREHEPPEAAMSKPTTEEGEDQNGSPQAEGTLQSEGASLSKEELVQIIKNQDQTLEILKKEIEALKRRGGALPTPGSKRREREEDREGASSFVRRTEEMGHLTRHLGSDFDEHNGWVQRRMGRRWGVRQPLARRILSELATSIIPALSTYDWTTDPEDHLNNYFTKMQLY
ncbi:unnamed protein product [Linum trigynum]|uniref:Uncharacterized protein n=1 Tax=Linum trigynum TaxID=586398 RepID=A0AAV2GQE7_9ROSI